MKATQDLMVREENTYEVAAGEVAAAATQEIQGAIVMAKKFPRNEEQAFARLMQSCERYTFADRAEYEFPRGGSTVRGPSVYLMREAARIWGNIRHGFAILTEDEDRVTGRGFAWDIESNAAAAQDFLVRKLIQRKSKGVTEWVRPDERDLRELVNNIGARAVRNCIRQILPDDLVEDATAKARSTIEAGVRENPDAAKKALIEGFRKLGVMPAMLDEYLGHPLAQTSPEELARLRGVWKAIRDGQATWLDYAPGDGNGLASGKAAAGTDKKTDELKEKLKNAKGSPPPEPWQPTPAWDKLAEQLTDLCAALDRPHDVGEHIKLAKAMPTAAEQLAALQGSVDTLKAEHDLKRGGGEPEFALAGQDAKGKK